MTRSARFGIIIVFLLGGLVTIISIVRLPVPLQTSEDDISCKCIHVFDLQYKGDYASIGL